MLNHQIEFSKAMIEIYKPISGRMSDPEATKMDGSADGVRACEEYEAVVRDLQETLKPELEMIETRVIGPANELLDVIKVIRKTATKREHKRLDYDRHRATLKKLQEKKDKTLKDEKAMYKAENEVEQATQEFNYYNDLLKDELPKLFALERSFIQPLFQSFYYMQLNIFYTLHEKMQQCDIGYFDLTLDIEEAFYKKRGNVQEEAESLSIVKFKSTGFKRPPKYGPGATPHSLPSSTKPAGLLPAPDTKTPSFGGTALPAPDTKTPSFGSTAASVSSFASASVSRLRGESNPPPPYSPGPAASPALVAAAAAKAKPPPPKPKPSRLSAAPVSPGLPAAPRPAPQVETCTALYDFSAQAQGDLSFVAGDVIEIVQRTANENEWWTGRIGGKTGQFPGKSSETMFGGVPRLKVRDRDEASVSVDLVGGDPEPRWGIAQNGLGSEKGQPTWGTG